MDCASPTTFPNLHNRGKRKRSRAVSLHLQEVTMNKCDGVLQVPNVLDSIPTASDHGIYVLKGIF